MKNNSILYNPKSYTLASLIIGYILIGDLTAYEQNAVGNWLMTVGQILESNSAIEQAIQERLEKNNNSNNKNNDYDLLLSNLSKNNSTISELKRMLHDLEKRLDQFAQKNK